MSNVAVIDKLSTYAVIVIDDEGKIGCHKVKAYRPLHAYGILARKLLFEFDAVYCLPWDVFANFREGVHADFPGESLVSRSTILEQNDVFGFDMPKRKRVRDWYIMCSGGCGNSYWNNSDGWTSKIIHATKFSDAEMRGFRLPLPDRTGDKVMWIRHRSRK